MTRQLMSIHHKLYKELKDRWNWVKYEVRNNMYKIWDTILFKIYQRKFCFTNNWNPNCEIIWIWKSQIKWNIILILKFL